MSDNNIAVFPQVPLRPVHKSVNVSDMTTMTNFPSGRVPADTLAARLVLIRHELGISQRKAAEDTGVPYGTWQGMEMGRATRDLNDHVRKIADAYGYDPVWIMWGTQSGPRPGGGPDGGQAPEALDELTNAKRRRHAGVSHTGGYPIAA